MPVLSGRFGRSGPLITVKLMASPQKVNALKRAGLAFPAPVQIEGLVDTGANSSCVDVHVLRGMGLVAVGSTVIHTPSSGPDGETRDQYDACFVLGEGQANPLTVVVPVIATELVSEGFAALLGRDLLAYCVLVCDGRTNQFSLVF